MATLCWRALGTSAVLRTRPRSLMRAYRAVTRELDEIDMRASRFRSDSELTRINARAGEWVPISETLAELVALGLWAAEVSDGAVDPTLARELERLGYDRDVNELSIVDPGRAPAIAADVPAVDRGEPWRAIELRDDGMIRLPGTVGLDLGAVAKGRAADLAAGAAHESTGAPVLVSLGGDVSVAGPPPDDGWTVSIAADHRVAPAQAETAVSIRSGGLATSSLTVRRWWHDGEVVHHVLDPRTGRPVTPHWIVATVAAATCAEANLGATAALVLGTAASEWLRTHGLPARLVAGDGSVVRLAGWPS